MQLSNGFEPYRQKRKRETTPNVRSACLHLTLALFLDVEKTTKGIASVRPNNQFASNEYAPFDCMGQIIVVITYFAQISAWKDERDVASNTVKLSLVHDPRYQFHTEATLRVIIWNFDKGTQKYKRT